MSSPASGTPRPAPASSALHTPAPDTPAIADQVRVLLVTRRFWPLTDDSAGRVATLAEGLRRGGMIPTILTARFSNAWPTEFRFREVNVLRPVAAPRREWTGGIYQRSLQRWLRENVSHFDILYADAMRDEGAAVVEIAETFGLPSVVRCGGSGCASDWVHASESRQARKLFNISLRADGLIAATATAERSLISSGGNREKIHRIADGIPPAIRCEKTDCLTARASLASINSDLRVPTGGQVVMVCGRFESHNQMMLVAQALAPLCDAQSNLRLWLIGDGPQRDSLHHYLQDRGIRTSAAMPGAFWHIDELIRASDLILFASDCESLEQRLPHAISGGVPVVVVDTPEMRSYFSDLRAADVKVETFRNNDPESLRNVVAVMLKSYDEHRSRAISIRSTLRKMQPREQSVEAHFRLFLRLTGRGGGGASGASDLGQTSSGPYGAGEDQLASRQTVGGEEATS